MTQENNPSPLSEEEIAKIEERANKATEGPWNAEWGYAGATRTLFLVRGDRFDGVLFGRDYDPAVRAQHEADTVFAANARQDIPRLIATIRDLQQQLAASQRVCKQGNHRFLDAVAHPEEWTKLRARLLQNEAILGRYPWSQPGATTTTEADDTETVTYQGPYQCMDCGKVDPPTAKAIQDETGKVIGFKCLPGCEAAPIKTEGGE